MQVLKNVQLQTPMQVFTKDGLLINQFGEKRRIPVTIDQIPEPLLQAFLATEDNRFYDHIGIDPIGISISIFPSEISAPSCWSPPIGPLIILLITRPVSVLSSKVPAPR